MTIRSGILTFAAVATAAVLPLGASAQIFNPDNDSATFFAYRVQSAPVAQSKAALPSVGQVSEDDRYVYSGSDRGWVQRQHAYTVQGGTLTHVSGCLPYNLPAPVAVLVLPTRTGAFADHGA